MRLKLISCEVLFREMCDAVARAPHQIDVEFLPKGLHDLGSAEMRQRLQLVVDRTDRSMYDAILMGYALCGTGLAGLTAHSIPIVLPRAHDCIALLMGSRHRYQEYFDANPGVYFRSTGWLERGESLEQIARNRTGVGVSLDDLIAKYGDDNGRYLYEELTAYQRAYQRLTFIETGLEAGPAFEERARQEAARRNWSFEKIAGDTTLFHRMVAGDWGDSDFLTVQPGFRIVVRYDDNIVDVEKCD